MAQHQRDHVDHVDVVGTGTASAAPDTVTLDLRVQCDGADVAGSLDAATTAMAAVRDAVRAHGVGPADLQTSGAGVTPRWDPRGTEVVGYTAHQSLRVRLRELDRSGAVIASAAQAGGNAFGLDGISMTVGDPAPLRQAARDHAFADARARAEQYAALAGKVLGSVATLSDVPSGGHGTREGVGLMAARSADVPVEAGESTVSVSVAVRWRWTDA